MDETDPYIAGIYNYCDRWCERCRFTSRCRLFAESEERLLTDEVAPKPGSAAFWQALARAFTRTSAMLREAAAQHGIDLDRIELAEATLGDDEERDDGPRRRSRGHPLVKAAEAYTWKAHAWLKEHEAPARRGGESSGLSTRVSPVESDLPVIDDALDVLRWFHFQIAVKLRRALSRDRSGEGELEPWDDPYNEQDAGVDDTDEIAISSEDEWQNDSGDWAFGSDLEDDPSQSWGETQWRPDDECDDDEVSDEQLRAIDEQDRNGSAKVALIGIDHSLAAWGALRESLASESETIFDMLVQLARLGRAVESEFPKARSFKRPGFDD
jgi:hypothetical protein